MSDANTALTHEALMHHAFIRDELVDSEIGLGARELEAQQRGTQAGMEAATGKRIPEAG